MMEQAKPTRLKPNSNRSSSRRVGRCGCCCICFGAATDDEEDHDDNVDHNENHQSASQTNQSDDGSGHKASSVLMLNAPIFLLWLLPMLPLLLMSEIPLIEGLIQVPNRHTVASIPGDLVLGILVPVHERPSPKQAQTRTCGAVREQYGIQRVEAAFRTIDSINADPKILPNITLGIEIRDSCWHSPIALEQSIEFIRDAMAASEQTPPGATGTNHLLNSQQQPFNRQPTTQTLSSFVEQQINSNTNTNNSACAPLLRQQQLQLMQTKKVKNLVGVVGPASSTDTVQVQNLLQLFNMPQVGYSATSRDLSNKNFFKYFLRVVPSDKLQAQVLIDLMLAHNWTYITVAYTEGSYGSSLMNEFRERAQEAGICFATLESMPPNADDAKFDELIHAIQKHPNARVVICMCEGRTVGRLFAGFKRKNINNEYLVVGSDGWSDRFDVVEQQEEFALGGISIRIHSAYVYDFDDYYFSLSPFTNQRNPWFAEFWETRFQCNLETPTGSAASSLNSNRPAYIRPPGAKVYNRTCTGKESLRQNHKQDAKMAFVQKSIITMALALDSMQRAICPAGRVGLCPEMLPVNGSILLQHLMNVRFTFLDEEVYFDEQGDPPGKYEILNFRRRRGRTSSSGSSNPSTGNNDDDLENFPTGATSDSVGLSPDVDDEANESVESGDPKANENQDFSIVAGAGDAVNKANNRKIKRPYADSYSTLKVFRSSRQRHSDEQVSSPQNGAAGLATKRRRYAGWSQGRRQLHWTPDVTRPPPGARLIINKRQQRNRQRAQPQMESYSSTSDFEYVHVGSWKSSDGLSLFGDIQWPLKSQANADTPHWSVANDSSESSYHFASTPTSDVASNFPLEPPKSVCSLPCAKGHAKKIQSDSVKCCWVCVACRPREYLFNEFKCKACEKGWWPNSDQTGCNQIPIQYLDWRSMEALTAISIASFGLILTLATGFVFIRHNDTPVVKSSTRELSYMILFAMILCYVNTFFLIAKPRKETCFVTRILPGFSFAMMYGALVTKTNRIARILAGSKKKIITRRPHFMSATAQVTITWLIVLIECAIIVAVLIKEPPDKMHDYPSDDRVVLVCNTTTTGIIAPLGFDFFLIAMCTLYAFKTRNVPENFNEAKFIGFTMYTTLVIWVAFVAIYLSSDHKVTTLCLCISFSALFALFLLFFPRCYIILFKPEKNNRSFFTTTKNVRCHIGYQITAGHGGGGGTAAPVGAPTTSTSAATITTGNTANSHWANWQTTPAGQPIATISSRQQQCPCSLADCPLPPPLLASGSPKEAQDHHHHHQQQQLDEQQWRQNLRHNSRTLTSGRRVAPTNDLQELERPAGHQDSVEGGPKAPLEGVNNPAGGQQEHRSSGDSLRHFFGSLRSAFARRSRRKESDKQSSIQQHLRAIRHAENLDRQTHFRRSQVQRLAQRFESNPNTPTGNFKPHSWLPNHLLSPSSSFKQQQQQQPPFDPTMIFQFSESFEGPERPLMSLEGKFELLTRGCEAQRLLATLNQLIGIENMWRLASVMNRFCKTQTGASNEEEENNDTEKSASDRVEDKIATAICQSRQQPPSQAGQHFPLDLRRLADRHLALAWLRFLIQMAHKAIESLQLNCNHVQSASDQQDLARLLSLGDLSSGGGRRRRATLDQLGVVNGPPPRLLLLPGESLDQKQGLIVGQEANHGFPSEHMKRETSGMATGLDHQDDNQTRQPVAGHSSSSPPLPPSPSSLSVSPSSSSLSSSDRRWKSPPSNEEADPIKRALDCITGKQWAAVGARQTVKLAARSEQRKRPPDRDNNNNDDNEIRKQDHLIESKERNSNCDPATTTTRAPTDGGGHVVTSREANDAKMDHHQGINSLSGQQQQQQWPQTTANTSPEPFKSTMMTSNKRNYNINNNRPATLQSCDKISAGRASTLTGKEEEAHRLVEANQTGSQTTSLACCRQCCCPDPVACCEQTQFEETTTTARPHGNSAMLSRRCQPDLEDRNMRPEGGRGGNASATRIASAGQQANGPQEIMLPIVGRVAGNNEPLLETQITWTNSDGEYSRADVEQTRDTYSEDEGRQSRSSSGPNIKAGGQQEATFGLCSCMSSDSNQLDRCMLNPGELVGSQITTTVADTKGNNNNNNELELHNLTASIDNDHHHHQQQRRWRQINNKSCPSGAPAGQQNELAGELPFEAVAATASTGNQLEGERPVRRCRRSRRLDCCRRRGRHPQSPQEQQLAPGDQVGAQSTCSGPCRLIKSRTDECVWCASSSCCSSLTRRNERPSHHHGQASQNNNSHHNHHHHNQHHHHHHHRHQLQRPSKSVPPSARTNGNFGEAGGGGGGGGGGDDDQPERQRNGNKTTSVDKGELVDVDSATRKS